MKICKEMQKLREYLTQKKIEWRDDSDIYDEFVEISPILDMSIYRTKFNHDGYLWSIVHGMGTYGEEKGLLELMTNRVNGGEPLGYLTADDVIALIEKYCF